MASMAGIPAAGAAVVPTESSAKRRPGALACINLCSRSWDLSGTALRSPSPSPTAAAGGRKHEGVGVQVVRAQGTSTGLGGFLSGVLGRKQPDTTKVELKATVVLAKKNVLDVQDKTSEAIDAAADLLGQNVDLQLVSVDLDPKTGEPKLSDVSDIKNWATADLTIKDLVLATEEDSYSMTFKVPKDFGLPGAFVIRNSHPNEFFLRSLTVELPDKSSVVFACNSVVYNKSKYPVDRVFFSNKAYLPSETPAGIKKLRELELQVKRGNGKGARESWERIYDYATYNDLSDPDKNAASIRSILGGSALPYPRRMRTGRPPSKKAPELESNVGSLLLELNYIPRDELFSREKTSSVLADAIKAAAHAIIPAIITRFDDTPNDFDSLQGIKTLYDKGVDLTGCITEVPQESPVFTNPFTLIAQFFNADGDNKSLLKYPLPDVIRVDGKAWASDEEFGRQALAGMNPLLIERVLEYPPKSTLDPKVYGPGTALTDQHITPYLDAGMTVSQAIQAKRLFKIDLHDIFLPYIKKQNTDGAGKGYAPRTIFFLTKTGTLKPIAIELALENSIRVFTAPPENAKEKDFLWELAKLHVNTVDFGYHELVSHWLETHAVIEPVIIAANRQLSDIHPIYTLLLPHFRNTVNINASARQALINAGGIIEQTFTPGKYCMEMSAAVYGARWRFDRQALPEDLIARGVAEAADASHPGGVKLLIEDYPFAQDGLELWDAIKSWVGKYVNLAYKGSDAAVRGDTELQAWWKEVVEVGHADHKTAPWWPKLDSLDSLVHTLTTIIWITGPHHASVNFGQFGYAGYMPNRPSMTRRLVPEVGSQDYKLLLSDPEKHLLASISTPSAALSVMTTIEILSTHAADEEYLGQRQDKNWSSDPAVLAAFQEFANNIEVVGKNIIARNKSKQLANRIGPAKLPYTLLYPFSTDGLTGQGVPNSISI